MSKETTKQENLANVDLARELASTFDLKGERAWWVKARGIVEAGDISVRGLKATIKLVEESGQCPTLRSSWSQYFEDAFAVEDLEGAQGKTLKDIFSVTIQGTRKAGGRDGFAEVMKGVKSFAQLSKKVEAMPKKEKAQGSEDEKGEALVTADSVVSFFIGAMADIEDITPADSAQWIKFLDLVSRMSKARDHAIKGAKARHASSQKVNA